MAEPLLPETLDKIESLAHEATAGPWLVWDDGDIGTAYPVERRARPPRGSTEPGKVTLESLHIANTGGPDAEYLAAVDPSTVLTLIARIKFLEAERLETSPAEPTEDEDPHEMIEAAIAEIVHSVGNPTLAWNLWNNLNTSPDFIKAFNRFHIRINQ